MRWMQLQLVQAQAQVRGRVPVRGQALGQVLEEEQLPLVQTKNLPLLQRSNHHRQTKTKQ